MKRRFDIQIEKPCKENWKTFEKKEDQGFCGNCQQSVIDFTNKTDQEIFEYFSLNLGKVCGRFKPQQLHTYSSPKEKFTFHKALLLTAGLLTVTTISKSSILKPRASTLTEQKGSKRNSLTHPVADNNIVSDTFRFYGTVIDSKINDGIIGARVLIRGSENEFITAIDGNFEIFYQGKEGDSIAIEFSYPGYKDTVRQVVVSRVQSNLGITILEEDNCTLGGVSVIRPWSVKGISRRIKYLFRSR